MQDMTFLQSLLIYMAVIFTALLLIYVPVFGKRLAYFFNIGATLFFILTINSINEIAITDAVEISKDHIRPIILLGIFNIVVSLLNNLKNITSSIISNFIFLSSVFLLGAQNFIIFFVAFKMLGILSISLINLSKQEFSREVAVKLFIQDSIVSFIFLLGVTFFFVSTGTLDFSATKIINQEFFIVSLFLLFVVAIFKMGVFPLHGWKAGVYSNIASGNLASSFLFSNVVFAYVFIKMIQGLLFKTSLQYQGPLIYGILILSLASVAYGNIVSLVQKDYRKILIYSTISHSGYLVSMICLPAHMSYDKHLMFYLTFFSISATGAFLLLNHFARYTGEVDVYKSLRGGGYKNTLAAAMLIIFILSLAGVPLTAGFTMKFLVFSDYFKEGYLLVPVTMLLVSILGYGYYVKYIIVLFMRKDERRESETPFFSNYQDLFVQLFLVTLVLAGGLVPSYFIN